MLLMNTNIPMNLTKQVALQKTVQFKSRNEVSSLERKIYPKRNEEHHICLFGFVDVVF